MARVDFPEAALAWLTAGADGAVLAVSASAGVPKLLANAGHEVVALVRDVQRAQRLTYVNRITPVVARPEALPFASHHFGLVVAHQVFSTWAPGLALPEMARVLRAGGVLAASYFARDDSVPWVRRLIALMQSIDADAMPPAPGEAAFAELASSKYFRSAATQAFRIWIPISRQGMLDMVAGETSVAGLDEAGRARLLDGVAEIYDGAARAAQLRLPYELRCWRGTVNHLELTQPVRLREDGLSITF
ncbi:MAG: class I SAM-dependent methyltransferase [Actinomycetia bacterium]|nr:class I SAM-dependent methyltransferase [Actinomycetes bacterium]